MDRRPGIVNILHLTDFHFTDRESPGARAHRETVLQAFLDQFPGFVESEEADRDPYWQQAQETWMPDLIAITGDLGFSGKPSEYRQFGAFLERFRKAIGRPDLPAIACPGNHDRDAKNSAGISYPESSHQADQWLSVERLQPDYASLADTRTESATGERQAFGEVLSADSTFSDSYLTLPFRRFQEFCARERFLKPTGISGLDYLTGCVRWPDEDGGIEFVVLNSAWFSNHEANRDARNLWLGLPLIEWLEHVRSRDHRNCSVRVALVHHPREWLHEEECNSYGERPNTYRLLAEGTDLILSGHVHGSLEPPSGAYSGALVLTGGASYVGGRWRNTFCLLQVNLGNRTVSRRGFEYDPRERAWVESLRAKTIHRLPFSTRGARESVSPERRAASVTVKDLEGEWASVFWLEGRPDVSKWSAVVRFLSEGEDGVAGSTVLSDARARPSERTYRIQARLAGEFLTGTWDSPGRTYRRGALQLRVCPTPKGMELRGRWLGFDRYGEINVGTWIFTKLQSA